MNITRTISGVWSTIALSLARLAATNDMTGMSATAKDATNVSWTYGMVTSYVAQLGNIKDKQTFQIVTNAAFLETLPVPSTIEEFVQSIYLFSLTNFKMEPRVLSILSSMRTTNESVSDIVLCGFTNYALLARQLPGSYYENKLKGLYNDRATASIRALQSIGTPSVIDKLNKVLRKLKDEGKDTGEPCRTISPDRFPLEAKDWLLNYPDDEVRMNMARNWLKSSRPETPELIKQHIKWCKTLPANHPYWSNRAGECWKDTIIKSRESEMKEFEVRYQRWIEDGKHLNINEGSYRDEYWEGYKKEREAERAKEHNARTGTTNNVNKSTP